MSVSTLPQHSPCALISVSDKTGIVPFAEALSVLGFTILSTGGTAKHLKEAGVEVLSVEDYTQAVSYTHLTLPTTPYV